MPQKEMINMQNNVNLEFEIVNKLNSTNQEEQIKVYTEPTQETRTVACDIERNKSHVTVKTGTE